jgi:paraquat-inducible protein B
LDCPQRGCACPRTRPLLEQSDIRAILFDSSNLGRWDSSLLIFLLSVCEVSRQRHIVLDPTKLPAAARRLLALVPAEPQAAIATLPRSGLVERVGGWIIGRWLDGVAFTTLVGEAALRTVPALRGKARMRAQDLLRIGRVEGMRPHIDVTHQTSWIPVYLEVNLDRISWTGGPGGDRADLQAAVDAGLRAQLVSQGLVRGEESVNLDYHPDTPALLAGHPEDAFEIPTIPSDIQVLKDELRKLDLPAIGMQTQQVLARMQHVLDELDGRIGPLADGLQTTLTTTADAVHRLQIATNGDDLDQLLKTAEQTTTRADELVATLNDMSSPRGDLQASLRDLAASASSLRDLTHDLERAPLGTLLRREK